MNRRPTWLLGLALTTAGCGTPLSDAADQLHVWVRQGYTSEEALYVSVRTDAETEGACPSFPSVEATLGELELPQADAGGWVDALLGEDHCAPATFVLSADGLAELGAVGATLALEDGSLRIELELPTIGSDRTIHWTAPTSNGLALGERASFELGAQADSLSTMDLWLSPESALCYARFDEPTTTNNSGSYQLVENTCPDGQPATLIARASYDLAVGEVRGIDRTQVSGVSYLFGDRTVELGR